jgi:hypothetical protein
MFNKYFPNTDISGSSLTGPTDTKGMKEKGKACLSGSEDKELNNEDEKTSQKGFNENGENFSRTDYDRLYLKNLFNDFSRDLLDRFNNAQTGLKSEITTLESLLKDDISKACWGIFGVFLIALAVLVIQTVWW